MIKIRTLLLLALLISINLSAADRFSRVSTNPRRAEMKLREDIVEHFKIQRLKTLEKQPIMQQAESGYNFIYTSDIPDSLISITKDNDKESYTASTSTISFFRINIYVESEKYYRAALEKLKIAENADRDRNYYKSLLSYISALDLSLTSFHQNADSVVKVSLAEISSIMESNRLIAPEGKLTFTEPEQSVQFRIYFAAEPEFSLAGIPLEISHNDKKIRKFTDKDGYITINPAIPNGETRFHYKSFLTWRILNKLNLHQRSIITNIISSFCKTSKNSFRIVLLGERKLFIKNNIHSEFSDLLTDMGYTIVSGETEADYVFDMRFVTIEKGAGQYGSFYALVFAEAEVTDINGKTITKWHSRKYERYSEKSEDDAVEKTYQPAIKSLKYNISSNAN